MERKYTGKNFYNEIWEDKHRGAIFYKNRKGNF